MDAATEHVASNVRQLRAKREERQRAELSKQALQKANDVRRLRSELKREIKAGTEKLESVFGEPPWWLRTATLYEIVLAEPRIRHARARQAFVTTGVSQGATFGRTTLRQRMTVLAALRSRQNVRQRPPRAAA